MVIFTDFLLIHNRYIYKYMNFVLFINLKVIENDISFNNIYRSCSWL